MLRLFKVKIAANSLSFVSPSFGMLDFSILGKNNPHELLISSISEGKTKNLDLFENSWAFFFFFFKIFLLRKYINLPSVENNRGIHGSWMSLRGVILTCLQL